MSYPNYLKSFKSGVLERKVEEARKMLEKCLLCPRKCGANRLCNEKGFCRTGIKPVVYSYMPHHGEEPPVSGVKGSGTIFFSNCNLGCVYCQNHRFSQEGEGQEVSSQELSAFMLSLQNLGCHNINLVTPTHVMPQALQALLFAVEKGLNIPLVYNTSGYELPEVIEFLGGVIDIYLADMRYAGSEESKKYSGAGDYSFYNQAAIKEMYKQVGNAEFNRDGIMKKGLIIRHLVLPNNASGTEEIMEFISKELSPGTYVSLMSQYHPYFKANQYPQINRCLTKEEYDKARLYLEKYGLTNGWVQDDGGLECFAGVNIKRNA